jgi:hypothetical protein
MELTAKRVDEILMDCLFNENEDTKDAVMVNGITLNIGFHPGRLEKHKVEIGELLAELPDSFKQSSGGGMSFLQACMDKRGNQWGEHVNMQQLFLLGMATKQVTCLLPREMWSSLPGGVPYYRVNDGEKKSD